MLRLNRLQYRTLLQKRMLYAVLSLAWAASSLTARLGKARLPGACCMGQAPQPNRKQPDGPAVDRHTCVLAPPSARKVCPD